MQFLNSCHNPNAIMVAPGKYLKDPSLNQTTNGNVNKALPTLLEDNAPVTGEMKKHDYQQHQGHQHQEHQGVYGNSNMQNIDNVNGVDNEDNDEINETAVMVKVIPHVLLVGETDSMKHDIATSGRYGVYSSVISVNNGSGDDGSNGVGGSNDFNETAAHDDDEAKEIFRERLKNLFEGGEGGQEGEGGADVQGGASGKNIMVVKTGEVKYPDILAEEIYKAEENNRNNNDDADGEEKGGGDGYGNYFVVMDPVFKDPIPYTPLLSRAQCLTLNLTQASLLNNCAISDVRNNPEDVISRLFIKYFGLNTILLKGASLPYVIDFEKQKEKGKQFNGNAGGNAGYGTCAPTLEIGKCPVYLPDVEETNGYGSVVSDKLFILIPPGSKAFTTVTTTPPALLNEVLGINNLNTGIHGCGWEEDEDEGGFLLVLRRCGEAVLGVGNGGRVGNGDNNGYSDGYNENEMNNINDVSDKMTEREKRSWFSTVYTTSRIFGLPGKSGAKILEVSFNHPYIPGSSMTNTMSSSMTNPMSVNRITGTSSTFSAAISAGIARYAANYLNSGLNEADVNNRINNGINNGINSNNHAKNGNNGSKNTSSTFILPPSPYSSAFCLPKIVHSAIVYTKTAMLDSEKWRFSDDSPKSNVYQKRETGILLHHTGTVL